MIACTLLTALLQEGSTCCLCPHTTQEEQPIQRDARSVPPPEHWRTEVQLPTPPFKTVRAVALARGAVVCRHGDSRAATVPTLLRRVGTAAASYPKHGPVRQRGWGMTRTRLTWRRAINERLKQERKAKVACIACVICAQVHACGGACACDGSVCTLNCF
jgi:hypothetical protein